MRSPFISKVLAHYLNQIRQKFPTLLTQQITCDPHSYERNFCNCVWKPEKLSYEATDSWFERRTGIARSGVQTSLKSEFLRLPYAVAKIAFTINIARIIYYLISHPQFNIMIHFIHKFITVNLGDILWYNVILLSLWPSLFYFSVRSQNF